MKSAYLVLENGMIFEGKYFGAQGELTGEIVFTTGMTGYLETLSDPSYYGQIILQTFPLIGNYGVIPSDFESKCIHTRGYIVKYPCQEPSNFRSERNIDKFLKQKGIIGLCDVDTRALTKIIRENGVMNGRIMGETPTAKILDDIKSYKIYNSVPKVSTVEKRLYQSPDAKYTVALYDFGTKESLIQELLARECNVWLLPWDCTVDDILDLSPDGIILSHTILVS